MESNSECDKQMIESPKVWTELKANGTQMCADDEQQTIQSMATDSMSQVDGMVAPDGSYPQMLPKLHCLESGDGTEYSVMAVLESDGTKRPYCPSVESRQLHNHKERLRRSRMKCSCDALRALVPGLTDKTDKATVLEHTVAFLFHLSKCPGVKCDDYLPTYPPPMSAKLLELYPTLMSGEYQYYESIPSADPDFASNESHIVEVRETNGTQYVITSDGSQYMVVDNTDTDQSMAITEEQPTQHSAPQVVEANAERESEQMSIDVNPKDEPMEPTPEECRKCVEQVVDMLSDEKENIDPNSVNESKPVRKKRAYRKRKDRDASKVSALEVQSVSKVRKQRKLKQKNVLK